MNKFYWGKIQDTDDPKILTKQVLIDLNNEVKNAIRNSNYKKVNYLKEQIKKINATQEIDK